MKKTVLKLPILSLFFLILTSFQCKEENPVSPPQNQSPQILSLIVFPTEIDSTDSVIVYCHAIDPDGDTLVYDWITDSRVKIKNTNNSYLFHTYESFHVFYPNINAKPPYDTCWIQCFARDVKGGSDAGLIRFIVIQD